MKTIWSGLNTLLETPSPFPNESGRLPIGEFEPNTNLISKLQSEECKVLVIGAGGLGCEILKNLALSGVGHIHVVDLDTIDISNLNRQFLFRQADVGKGKAETAANFIMGRVPTCHVTPHMCRIQTLDSSFYRQFKVIVSGLDNIEARRWLNSMIISMVEYDTDGDPDPSTIIPLIDGGTEGFKGQARVIIPKITSCFECSIDSFPPQRTFPMCTIAETPRLPEHCIAYAFTLEWERHFPDKTLDKDNPDDMNWVYERALARANKFGIQGVTYFKTIGVVKNIIPAVASTNAVIAGMCVNEAVKLLTFSSQTMNTYCMYMGSQGIYSYTFEYMKNDQCIVCSEAAATKQMNVDSCILLKDYIELLQNNASFQLKKPSITTETSSLYIQNPPSLEQALRKNLEKPLHELIENDSVITITDPMLHDISLSIQIHFN